MKLLCLISGGLDSPVAAHLLLKRGANVDFVHMDTTPVTGPAQLNKVRKLISKLAELHHKSLKLYIFPHYLTQTAIVQTSTPKNICVLCKTTMYLSAQHIARNIGADALVTGENLGQVASQTLSNLTTEAKFLKIPILRPLIAYNKQEIMDIAKSIGTYDISNEPTPPCSFLPAHPATHSSFNEIESELNNLDFNTKLLNASQNITTEVISSSSAISV